jgi:site-specific DNA-methyltransferase (adenine-specific)
MLGTLRNNVIAPYYNQSGITLYHADCLDVLPTLPAQSVDLVLADLPYGTTACAWDSVISLDRLWAEYRRLITPNGALVFTASQPFTSVLVCSNLAWFRYCWVWEKSIATGFLDADRRPLKAHEDVVVFYASQPTYNPQQWQVGEQFQDRRKTFTFIAHNTPVYHALKGLRHKVDDGTRNPLSIISIPSVRMGHHPNEKPLALMEYLIRTYSNPGDLVLDNTMGSGTTPRAAKNLGRRCWGIEQDAGYCAVAARRLAQEVLALEEAA